MQNGQEIPAFSQARLAFCLFILLILSGLAAGCGAASGNGDIANAHPVAIQGKVHGGEQPIVGAQVYLYAAGTTGTSTTGYGANAPSLLNAPGYVTTLGDGSFSLTGMYDLSACQSSQDLVYVIAVGGNSGGTGNNPGTVLMSALGNCANLNANTFVWVNEVTTVASVYALQQFMNPTAGNYNVGTSSTNVTGLKNAFLAVTNLVNSSTGTALTATPNGNGTVPQAEIDTLANIIAACVNSVGGSSVCTNLFTNATPPSGTAPADTLHAMLDIAQNPGNSVTALYNTPPPQVPFAPALTAAPNDWTVAIQYTGGGLNAPGFLAVDARGNIWTPDFEANSISEFNTLGVSLQGSSGISSNVPNEPQGIAVDPSGNIWVPGYGSTSLAEFSSTGAYLSSVDWNCNTQNIGIDASGNIYGANVYFCKYTPGGTPSSTSQEIEGLTATVDGAGNIWVPNEDNSYLSEYSGTLILVAGEPSMGWSDPKGSGMTSAAIDAEGNVWAANGGNPALVTELSSSGSVLSGSGYPIAYRSFTIAIDGNDSVWTANFNGSVSHLDPSGAALSPAAGYKVAGVTDEDGVAVDSSGNLWTASNLDNLLVEWVGLAAPVATPLVQNLVNNPTTIGQRP